MVNTAAWFFALSVMDYVSFILYFGWFTCYIIFIIIWPQVACVEGNRLVDFGVLDWNQFGGH